MTERAIKTLRYEWLKRVPLIKGFKHLERLCSRFVVWYDTFRPHMTLNGFTPDDFYCRDFPQTVPRDAKVVPLNIERRFFKDASITGYRLSDAA